MSRLGSVRSGDKDADRVKAVHHAVYHYVKKFSCGLEVNSVVDRENEWGLFNKMRSTTWRDVSCRECLEHLYNVKKRELQGIGEKLGEGWQ